MPERRGDTTLDPEAVHPAHAALIVVDLQNDYCSPLGAYGLAGTDLSMMSPVIARAAGLIDAAREAGVLVVWLQQTTLRDGLSAAPSALRSRDRYLVRERCVEGTFGHAFVSPLAPTPDEPVVRKLRSSGFVGTMLDQVLDANGIRTCVLIGVGTEGCIEATARSAADHNYVPVVVADGVASTRADLHAHSLVVLQAFARIARAEAVMRAWRAAPRGKGLRPGVVRRAHATIEAIVRPAHTALVVASAGGLAPQAIERLAQAARAAGALVVLLRPGLPSGGDRAPTPESARGPARNGPAADGDLVIDAVRPDGFEGTPLHLHLDARGIHTVVMAGARSHREVESTARGAVHRNYYVVCVEDAVADADPALQEAALAIMRQRYDVLTTARLMGIWAGATLRAE